ncbi:MAG: DUF2520 domain-containing protein [Muribaculum sp.]|nr:DUF2520 domain-containing protein [Muribaculum sp.]
MKIQVIGRGNVGTQFSRIFGVDAIPSRTLEGLTDDADLYIISVSDSAVEEVAGKLPKVKGIVVHTTGSVPMSALKNVECKGYGVVYPFQTISKQRPLDAEEIPLLLEASDTATSDFLVNTAHEYGFDKIQMADSKKRGIVHLTGTFACNFTNAMIAISQKILSETGIDAAIVNPLIAETFEKIKKIPAKEAQTGPAIRKDSHTLEKHIALLNQIGMRKESHLYANISEYIANNS